MTDPILLCLEAVCEDLDRALQQLAHRDESAAHKAALRITDARSTLDRSIRALRARNERKSGRAA